MQLLPNEMPELFRELAIMKAMMVIEYNAKRKVPRDYWELPEPGDPRWLPEVIDRATNKQSGLWATQVMHQANSFGAEMAVAKLCNCWFPLSTSTYDPEDLVIETEFRDYTVDVKYSHLYRNLTVKQSVIEWYKSKGKSLADLYVQVFGNLNTGYEIIGYRSSSEVIKDKNLRTDLSHAPGYFVHERDLIPLANLWG